MNSDAEHMCLAAIDVCGCTGMVTVLGYGHDEDAYKSAAREAKAGLRIEHMTVAAWKERGWHCADHPDGPPWWKSRGGNGKRPADYAAPLGMGL